MEIALLVAIAAIPASFYAGYWLKGQQVHKARHVKIEHEDEYLVLKEGVFVPLNPPQFVPKGMHPTVAARKRTALEGVKYSTRRVE